MRSPLAEALAALGRALGKLGLRWYLFGAQAALLYGAARLTADIGRHRAGGAGYRGALLQAALAAFLVRLDLPLRENRCTV